jgi:hypothetical protein
MFGSCIECSDGSCPKHYDNWGHESPGDDMEGGCVGAVLGTLFRDTTPRLHSTNPLEGRDSSNRFLLESVYGSGIGHQRYFCLQGHKWWLNGWFVPHFALILLPYVRKMPKRVRWAVLVDTKALLSLVSVVAVLMLGGKIL